MVGHLALGQQLVAERAARLAGLPESKLLSLSTASPATMGPTPLPAGASARPRRSPLSPERARRGGEGRARARAPARARVAHHACLAIPWTKARVVGHVRAGRSPAEPNRTCPRRDDLGAATTEAVEELLRQLVDARFVLTDRDGALRAGAARPRSCSAGPAPACSAAS